MVFHDSSIGDRSAPYILLHWGTGQLRLRARRARRSRATHPCTKSTPSSGYGLPYVSDEAYIWKVRSLSRWANELSASVLFELIAELRPP